MVWCELLSPLQWCSPAPDPDLILAENIFSDHKKSRQTPVTNIVFLSDLMPFCQFLKKLFTNLILYTFQPVSSRNWLESVPDAVNFLFYMFGSSASSKTQPEAEGLNPGGIWRHRRKNEVHRIRYQSTLYQMALNKKKIAIFLHFLHDLSAGSCLLCCLAGVSHQHHLVVSTECSCRARVKSEMQGSSVGLFLGFSLEGGHASEITNST